MRYFKSFKKEKSFVILNSSRYRRPLGDRDPFPDLEIFSFMREEEIWELHSKMDEILFTMNVIKDSAVKKVYNTKELSEYLKIGVSAIEKLRQDGELAYSKLGRTIVYTQNDVDALIKNNHVSYVR